MLRYEMRKALYQLNVQFWNLWHFNPSITDILLLSNNFLYWIQRPNCPNSQTCINFSTQSSQMRKIISNGCKTKTKILNKQKKKPREDENKFYSILVLIIRLWSQHVQCCTHSVKEMSPSFELGCFDAIQWFSASSSLDILIVRTNSVFALLIFDGPHRIRRIAPAKK